MNQRTKHKEIKKCLETKEKHSISKFMGYGEITAKKVMGDENT